MKGWKLARSVLVGLVLGTAGVAVASDGVLEINQACALQTGCFTGDAPGFPVEIASPGSYRLSSSLAVASGDGIVLGASAALVTLDLNGFRIAGPGAGSGVGIRGEPGASSITIRDGSIAAMGGDGIRIEGTAVIRAMQLLQNGGDGAEANETSIVSDSRVVANGGYGVRFAGAEALFHGNLFAANALGSVLGGRAAGANLCDGSSCTSFQARRYYVTELAYDGSEADEPGVCAPGFHFASFWEIHDPSGLLYDTAHGATSDDAGQGPPANTPGWVRTGWPASTVAIVGTANCDAWNTTSSWGTLLRLSSDWADESSAAQGPWRAVLTACTAEPAVWCVQD